MTFLELYEQMHEESFRVGDVLVRLVEISEATYSLSEASDRIPGNMASLAQPPVPEGIRKFRATYTMNGHEITNYLTAANRNEAKRMLFDYLEDLGTPKQRAAVVNSSDISPVDNWNELIGLLQYSMKWDHKKKIKGLSDTNPFQSLDSGDFHLMLTMVQKNPEFVKTHLSALPQDMQWYFKKAYNGLSKRDLDKDLSGGKGSYWGSQLKNLIGGYGREIGQRLGDIKTRHSPGERAALLAQAKQGSVPPQGELGTQDQPTVYGRPPLQPQAQPQAQRSRLFR